MAIDKLFTVIKKGEWHSLSILSTKIAIPQTQLQKIAETLSEANIIQYNPETKWIKLNPEYATLLTEPMSEEELTEPKIAVATFIIPPQTSVHVQSTHISNLSNTEIEVNLRIDNKIKEIAISV